MQSQLPLEILLSIHEMEYQSTFLPGQGIFSFRLDEMAIANDEPPRELGWMGLASSVYWNPT
jgi:hypothetical protein